MSSHAERDGGFSFAVKSLCFPSAHCLLLKRSPLPFVGSVAILLRFLFRKVVRDEVTKTF